MINWRNYKDVIITDHTSMIQSLLFTLQRCNHPHWSQYKDIIISDHTTDWIITYHTTKIQSLLTPLPIVIFIVHTTKIKKNTDHATKILSCALTTPQMYYHPHWPHFKDIIIRTDHTTKYNHPHRSHYKIMTIFNDHTTKI